MLEEEICVEIMVWGVKKLWHKETCARRMGQCELYILNTEGVHTVRNYTYTYSKYIHQ